MDFDTYLGLYLDYLAARFEDDHIALEDAALDAYEYTPNEWDYRDDFRESLPDFTECLVSGSQGICDTAGTFCDHPMTRHNNAYWM